MERNRLRYFIVAVAMLVCGYFARSIDDVIWQQTSFAIVTAGIYFLFAIVMKKAASWVLVVINLVVCVGIHFLNMLDFEWYNYFYNSEIGRFIIGGPADLIMLGYIAVGTVAAALMEVLLRQYNQVGMG